MRTDGRQGKVAGLRLRAGLLAAAVYALALAAPATAPAYTAPDPGGSETAKVPIPPSDKMFGLNDDIIGGAHGLSPFNYSQVTKLAGGNVIRTIVDWRRVEPIEDDWDENELADITDAYNKVTFFGLRPVFIVAAAPAWVRDPTALDQPELRYPPDRTKLNEWQELIQKLVTDYPFAIIQVWNEPNLNSWWRPAPEPARFAELVDIAHDTAKAVNPAVPVVAGGIANNQDGQFAMRLKPFLDQAYAWGEGEQLLENNMDYLGVNMFPHSTEFGKNTLLAKSFQDVREARQTAGDDTPLLITETGLPAGKYPLLSERVRARALLRLYRKLMTINLVKGVIFHRIVEPGDLPGGNPVEDSYAWFKFNTDPMRPKPVFCQFAERAGNLWPPCLRLRVAGPSRVRGTSARFKFKLISLDAKVKCSLDSKRLRKCKRKVRFRDLSRGGHVLRARARDMNGNRSPLVKKRFRVAG